MRWSLSMMRQRGVWPKPRNKTDRYAGAPFDFVSLATHVTRSAGFQESFGDWVRSAGVKRATDNVFSGVQK